MRKNKRIEIVVFMILIAAVALGNGLSDSVYANYFKEVYNVDAVQRGFIEFPRELPGVLCVFVIALLSFIGDFRIAVIAQLFSTVGLVILGLFTPSFGTMLIFLFIASTGLHIFMPLQDSMGMALAEPDLIGKRMGQYGSVKSMFSFIAGVIVFVGFQFKWLSFQTPIKVVFLLAALAFIVATLAAIVLVIKVKKRGGVTRKVQLLFRKEYKYYYGLAILNGVQKQIAIVYGTWVIVEILSKGADTVAILLTTAHFICIFFMRRIGDWIDKLGIQKMMFVDAFSFIFVYVIYGFVIWGITADKFSNLVVANVLIYLLFILDRLSMQIGIVRAVYLKSIVLNPEEVTPTLSTGISLDHVVSIIASVVCGYIWMNFGSQWVFFLAAIFSLGNVYIAMRIRND